MNTHRITYALGAMLAGTSFYFSPMSAWTFAKRYEMDRQTVCAAACQVLSYDPGNRIMKIKVNGRRFDLKDYSEYLIRLPEGERDGWVEYSQALLNESLLDQNA